MPPPSHHFPFLSFPYKGGTGKGFKLGFRHAHIIRQNQELLLGICGRGIVPGEPAHSCEDVNTGSITVRTILIYTSSVLL